MRDSSHSQSAQESNKTAQTRRYPVSSKAYNKKDYDYLSTFPRLAPSAALRAYTQNDDVELSRQRSDGESDLFMTTSPTDYATSVSSASSTSSSAASYAKNAGSLTDMESDLQHQSQSHHDRPHRHHSHHHHHHHHQQHHKHHHDNHLQLKETSALYPQNSAEKPDLQKVNEEKSSSESNSEFKDDLPDPAENGSVEGKEVPIRLRAKVRSRHIDTPAVLPKFGSWDTKNPSSGEVYTLIFKRLRDEKKLGAVPICGSPTHPKVEETDEPLKLEIKAKEPLCPNSRARKDFSGGKAKTTSHQEAAQYRTRWILCCKTSVLDD